MRFKVSAGFNVAADFSSEGMFWENVKSKAERKEWPHLIQGEEAIRGLGCSK